MANLILIDDKKIRKQAFSKLEKLLKKLQRMETNVESFHERDERLFKEWFELTFREQQQQVAALRGQYRELADFHNQMHALAQMEDLSLPEAAFILREEERLLHSGSEEQRRLINDARRLREQFVHSQSERNEKRFEREDDEASEDRYIPPDEEDMEESELIAQLDDEELREWCASSKSAFILLGKTLRVASFTKDFTLFFRLWDVTHVKVQEQFARRFMKEHGYSLIEVIEEMRGRVNDGESVEGAKLEALKLTYRQLARKLHPDMHAAAKSESADWRKKMWERVQEAYKRQDGKALNKLFHLVLLRGRELEQLRLSELHMSHKWLADEIEQTNHHVKKLRRQPAWGFSRRKDFQPIKQKLEREMAKVRDSLEEQVIELRTHHAFLERMGRESAGSPYRRRRRGRGR